MNESGSRDRVAVGFLHRDVSGVRRQWDEERLRTVAQRSGYHLAKILAVGAWTDRPVLRLRTAVDRLGAEAVLTPNLLHFDRPEIPGELADFTVVTVDDMHTYAGSGTVARHTIAPYGPIRPEDATDGWLLQGDEREWWLSKDRDEIQARVRATTPTTCSWRIARPDGTLLRESSARTVREAKANADNWARHRDG